MANSSKGGSNRRPGVSEEGADAWKIAGATRVSTRLRWRGRAKPVRRDLGMGLDVGCHDVSVIGVRRRWTGGKTAILAIRPW